MRAETGDIWSTYKQPKQLLVLAASNEIDKYNDLKLKSGIRSEMHEAMRRIPGLEGIAGRQIRVLYPAQKPRYGFVQLPGLHIGVLHAMEFAGSDPRIRAFSNSLMELCDWLTQPTRVGWTVNMPMPKTSSAAVTEAVTQLLNRMPDSFVVWKAKKIKPSRTSLFDTEEEHEQHA